MELASESDTASSRHRANGRKGGSSPKAHKSSIFSGSKLLPNASGCSVWARIMRDCLGNLTAHLGGAGAASETQRLGAWNASVLQAELVYLADKIARARQDGDEPSATIVDLFGRLANQQRRLLEPLGWERQPRDVMSLADLRQLDLHAQKAEQVEQTDDPA
jgi:hypothetical protein